ncbi:MAG: acetylglutamate kinase [Planctomycetes bacterium]|nr:acetylglutamate kinase [Planctomycetota bacterium]
MSAAPANTARRSGPLVIKIGGNTLESQSSSPDLWRALVATAHATPGGIVLLHGGGKAVDRHLSRLGFPTVRREGIRITPQDQIDEIVAVLAGTVNKRLVASINAAGGQAVGLCLGDGGLGGVPTAVTTRFAFDPGLVGDVAQSGNPRLLRTLLTEGFLPVVSSIGIDAQGRFLNVNADDAASGVAAMLGACALVLLTDVPGIMDADKRIVPELTAEHVESFIASGVISGGMIPKSRAAVVASSTIGAPVVILNGNDTAEFTRFLRGEPVGSRIISAR